MSRIFEGNIVFKLCVQVHRDEDGQPHVVHDLYIDDDIKLTELSLAFYKLFNILLLLAMEEENFPPDFEYTEFREGRDDEG